MKSLFNPTDNSEIISRINLLNTNSTPQWGKMNVSQMMAHCVVPLKTAFGELVLKKTFIGFLFGNMAKKKILGPAGFDKNLPTAKEFKVVSEKEFEKEKKELINYVNKFVTVSKNGITKAPHPFFGNLTPEEWDALQYKHLDHHLTQFGV